MTPLKPWFWPQSQTSYDRMYTRMGSFDFATKLKITPQTLMPGFGPFYRSILLSRAKVYIVCRKIVCNENTLAIRDATKVRGRSPLFGYSQPYLEV